MVAGRPEHIDYASSLLLSVPSQSLIPRRRPSIVTDERSSPASVQTLKREGVLFVDRGVANSRRRISEPSFLTTTGMLNVRTPKPVPGLFRASTTSDRLTLRRVIPPR